LHSITGDGMVMITGIAMIPRAAAAIAESCARRSAID